MQQGNKLPDHDTLVDALPEAVPQLGDIAVEVHRLPFSEWSCPSLGYLARSAPPWGATVRRRDGATLDRIAASTAQR